MLKLTKLSKCSLVANTASLLCLVPYYLSDDPKAPTIVLSFMAAAFLCAVGTTCLAVQLYKDFYEN